MSPVRRFALQALLWLPLSFVLWLALAAFLVWPAVLIATPVLIGPLGDLVESVRLGGEMVDAAGRGTGWSGHLVQLGSKVRVLVPPGPDGPGGVGVLEPVLNPLVYGWSLPLFAGLAMATPLTGRRRLLQLAIAALVIWLAQAFGLVSEALKVLAFNSGPEGAAAVARVGIPPNVIAFCYQFGYLILPAVVPVALWIGLNQGFIHSLTRPGEPKAAPEGPS